MAPLPFGCHGELLEMFSSLSKMSESGVMQHVGNSVVDGSWYKGVQMCCFPALPCASCENGKGSSNVGCRMGLFQHLMKN